MRHQYTTRQWVPHLVPEVFLFFANPENLPRLMPSWQKVSIENLQLAPPPPRPFADSEPGDRAAGAGSRMTIQFRPLPLIPLRLAWDARITEFEWNSHFCDEQEQRGPFAYWRHCHSLKEEVREAQTGTLVTDQLIYELPLGWLGEIAHALGVGRQIRALFQYRQKRLLEWLAR